MKPKVDIRKSDIINIKPKERLRFKIVSRRGEIAAFLVESDRDLCLDHLREVYDDADFEAKEESK